MNTRYFRNKHKNMRAASNKRGVEYSLTPQLLRQIMSANRCYYTGRPLLVKPLLPGEPEQGDQITLDRVDHKAGYVPGNVVACSLAVNRIKGRLENGEPSQYPSLERLIIRRVVEHMRTENEL